MHVSLMHGGEVMNVNAASSMTSIAFSSFNDISSKYAYLSEDDISTLEKATGAGTFSDLETNYSSSLEHFNTAREDGTVSGDLEQYLPTSQLTASDDALLEKVTGTTSIGAAVNSSPDAFGLMMQISGDRASGVLTGNITASYLNNLLPVAQQAASGGESGTVTSTDFLDKAISEVQQNS
jgi:hypothetical protein